MFLFRILAHFASDLVYRTSPANFYGVGDVELLTGTLSPDNTGVSSTCVVDFWSPSGLPISNPANPGLGFVSIPPESEEVRFLTDRNYVITFGQDFYSELVSQIKQQHSLSFDVAACSFIPGEGAPRVHVPMQALTDYQSETVSVKGLLNTAIAPAAAATPAAPAPRPSSMPTQTSKAQPIQSISDPVASPARLAGPSIAAAPAQSPVSQQSANPNQPQPAPSLQSQPPPVQSQGQSLPSQGHPEYPQPQPSQERPALSEGQQASSKPQSGQSRVQAPQPQAPTRLPPETPTPISAVIIGSNTVVVSIQTASPAVVLPGDITLRPGQVVTFSSQVLSLQPTGGALVVLGKSSTTTIPVVAVPQVPTKLPQGTPTPVSVVVLGSNTVAVSFQASSPAVVLPGGITLKPGSVVTYSSLVLSLQSTGSALIVLGQSSTTTIPLVAPAPTDNLQATAVTIASAIVPIQYVTGTAGGIILPDGHTLLPGSATEVNGVTLSLAPSATELIIGTSTAKLTGGGPTSTRATVAAIGSATMPIQYVTGTAGGVIFPNGATLLPGSATEVNGVTVSLPPSVTELVIGSSTVQLTGGTPASISHHGAGDYIWSGIGGGPAATSTPAQFTGGASRLPVHASVALAFIVCSLLLIVV